MSEFNDLVNKMTNHERNQWARAGYPGLRRKDVEELRPHARAAHRRLTGEWLVFRSYTSLNRIDNGGGNKHEDAA